MPAAVLVLVILGAICVDFSVAYLAQRQLKDAAVAAANDAYESLQKVARQASDAAEANITAFTATPAKAAAKGKRAA